MKKNRSDVSAFSLLEILVTMGVIIVLLVGILLVINPLQQIGKANDAKRKHTLAELQKALEDYYNDKGCYPRPDQICYDAAQAFNVCNAGNKTALSQTCHVCGTEPGSPSFTPYMSSLPCDPNHPKKDYYYEAEMPLCTRGSSCSTSVCPATACPSWYRVYSNLNNTDDPDSEYLGCSDGGCGLDKGRAQPSGAYPYGYEYGISGGRVGMEHSISYWCVVGGACNNCGSTYRICVENPQFGCIKGKIFSSAAACTANIH